VPRYRCCHHVVLVLTPAFPAAAQTEDSRTDYQYALLESECERKKSTQGCRKEIRTQCSAAQLEAEASSQET